MAIRGIEHIGITVSNLSEAESFFIEALGATVLYCTVPAEKSGASVEGEEMHPLNGFPKEMNVTGLTMLRLANGVNVELFKTSPPVKDNEANPGVAGINHFSLYVDDIHAVADKMRKHGASMFDGPSDCFAQEQGRGNQTWFAMTPFGVLIELITLPSPLHYDEGATETRWIPAR
ncbi:bleomycin resistance protein [Enterobacteriaceae bacterium RIT697]|nr:bleomycin resistance protein [Enterobacteriaceae bacterium RIT697]